MAYRVVISPQSKADIADVFAYLVRHGATESAKKWVSQIEKEMFSLDEMPNRFPVSPESSKFLFEIRQLIFGKGSGTYRIIYRIDEALLEVHVLTVRHASSDEMKMEDLF